MTTHYFLNKRSGQFFFKKEGQQYHICMNGWSSLFITSFTHNNIFGFIKRQSKNSPQTCFLTNNTTTSDENITRKRPHLIQITSIIRINITNKPIARFLKLQIDIKSVEIKCTVTYLIECLVQMINIII